jgi:hypothetical protein
MRIVGGDKLETVVIEEITSEIVKSGDYTAYAKEQDKKSSLILGRYGTETIINQGETDYVENYSNSENVKFFGDIKFSNSGNYLTYSVNGQESAMTHVYDISNDKEIFNFNSGFSGFSADEKSFFVCTNAGMISSPAGTIYNVFDFKKQFELFNSDKISATEVRCNYDKDKNELIFTYDTNCSQFDDKNCKKTEVVYSFSENKMISSRASGS